MYDSEAWQSQAHGVEVQIWGIQAPGLGHFLGSHVRHEMFDKLSGILPAARQRDDRIKVDIFARLKKLLMNSAAEKIVLLSHKFFAHAATTDSRGTLAFSGIKFSDVDEVQRAFVRVERIITDLLLFIAIGRQVVPMPPLGLFKGLENPYASSDSRIWTAFGISWRKNATMWAKGIEQDIL